jgi:hypothetical protein
VRVSFGAPRVTLLAEAEDRRDQRRVELDRAADLLAGVTVWIQPAPQPSRTSQAATADRVQ